MKKNDIRSGSLNEWAEQYLHFLTKKKNQNFRKIVWWTSTRKDSVMNENWILSTDNLI